MGKKRERKSMMNRLIQTLNGCPQTHHVLQTQSTRLCKTPAIADQLMITWPLYTLTCTAQSEQHGDYAKFYFGGRGGE